MQRVRTIMVFVLGGVVVFALWLAHDDQTADAIVPRASRVRAAANEFATTIETGDGIRVTRADAVADLRPRDAADVVSDAPDASSTARDPLDLLCATRVVGRVVRVYDGIETSVPAALVRAEPMLARAASAVDARTDAAGSFALELRERGTFLLTARLADAISAALVVEGMQSVTVDVDVLVLERGHTAASPPLAVVDDAVAIVGRVVDADGRLVEGCSLRANGVEVRSDDHGRFRFEADAGDETTVVARHPRSGSGEIAARPGVDIEIRLHPVASVVATLVDATRFGPAPRIDVELLQRSASGAVAQPTSFGLETHWNRPDEFVVAGLDSDKRYRIHVAGAHGVTGCADVEVPSPPPARALGVRVEPRCGSSIEVMVVDERGAPMRDASVVVAVRRESAAAPEAPAIARTDAAGCATFVERPAAPHAIRVDAPSCAPAFASVPSCDSVVTSAPRSVCVTLARCARVRGVAPAPRDAVRAPWVRATQTDGVAWTRLAADGAFAFDALAPGAVELTLWPFALLREPAGDAGLALPSQHVELAPGDDAHVAFAADVSSGLRVAVVVEDAAGRGVAGLALSAQSSGRLVARQRTDAAGRAVLELPWSGAFTLIAGGEREGAPHASAPDVRFDTTHTELRIRAASALIDVAVRDRSGAPIVGHELEVWLIGTQDDVFVARATTASDGSVRLGPFAPQRLRLTDASGATRDLELRDGETALVDWVVERP